MATKKAEEKVTIIPMDIRRVKIKIIGDTPLIVHAWSEKAKREMLQKQMKTTVASAKDAKNPEKEFIDSMYWLQGKPDGSTYKDFEKAVKNGAKWGFPVGTIKMAGNSAAYRNNWVKNQMSLRGCYFLSTEWGEMAEIKGSIPKMREDMCRIGMGTADIRYRGEFSDWYMELVLEYNASGDMTLEQIINVMNLGGYCVGIGEWRPEKDGSFGKYHVEITE